MRKQNTKVHVYSVFAEIIIIKKNKKKRLKERALFSIQYL